MRTESKNGSRLRAPGSRLKTPGALGLKPEARSLKPERGFTLLETLVAVAILGTAVAASTGLLSTSLRNISRAEDYERAVLLARSQMNELLALPAWSDGQTWRGDWGGNYRWTARTERLREPGRAMVPETQELAPGGREMMRLVLVGAWTTPRGEKTLELETVRLQLKPVKP